MISHAGSLTNLAKYPASTVQILGAEKALFRALKTKGKLQNHPFSKTKVHRNQLMECSSIVSVAAFGLGDPDSNPGWFAV